MIEASLQSPIKDNRILSETFLTDSDLLGKDEAYQYANTDIFYDVV
jgi:hypothetical protein